MKATYAEIHGSRRLLMSGFCDPRFSFTSKQGTSSKYGYSLYEGTLIAYDSLDETPALDLLRALPENIRKQIRLIHVDTASRGPHLLQIAWSGKPPGGFAEGSVLAAVSDYGAALGGTYDYGNVVSYQSEDEAIEASDCLTVHWLVVTSVTAGEAIHQAGRVATAAINGDETD